MISIQRALLGAVTDHLVAVTCGFLGTEIRIHAYFNSNPSEKEIENISVVAAQVIADFDAPYTINESCSRLPNDDAIERLDFIAFLRAGYDNLKFV